MRWTISAVADFQSLPPLCAPVVLNIFYGPKGYWGPPTGDASSLRRPNCCRRCCHSRSGRKDLAPRTVGSPVPGGGALVARGGAALAFGCAEGNRPARPKSAGREGEKEKGKGRAQGPGVLFFFFFFGTVWKDAQFDPRKRGRVGWEKGKGEGGLRAETLLQTSFFKVPPPHVRPMTHRGPESRSYKSSPSAQRASNSQAPRAGSPGTQHASVGVPPFGRLLEGARGQPTSLPSLPLPPLLSSLLFFSSPCAAPPSRAFPPRALLVLAARASGGRSWRAETRAGRPAPPPPRPRPPHPET